MAFNCIILEEVIVIPTITRASAAVSAASAASTASAASAAIRIWRRTCNIEKGSFVWGTFTKVFRIPYFVLTTNSYCSRKI